MDERKPGAYFVRLHNAGGFGRVAVGTFVAMDGVQALVEALKSYPQLFKRMNGWRVEVRRMELP